VLRKLRTGRQKRKDTEGRRPSWDEGTGCIKVASKSTNTGGCIDKVKGITQSCPYSGPGENTEVVKKMIHKKKKASKNRTTIVIAPKVSDKRKKGARKTAESKKQQRRAQREWRKNAAQGGFLSLYDQLFRGGD